jgi:hypothetical protein
MNREKNNLINRLEHERDAFKRLISGLTEDQIAHAILEGNWSIKNVLAHITVWEVELLGWLDRASKGKPLGIPAPGEWSPFIEEFNQQTYLENRDRSYASIRQSFDRVYEQTLKALKYLPEDPKDSFWSVWLGGEPSWILFGTYHEHYREHTVQIKAGLGTVIDRTFI